MPRLIVNADDFGYTEGVNRAILELHRAGALSSATLMANGAALAGALAGLAAQARAPGAELGIGCHVVLVDGTPVSPPGELPTLAPLNGSFRPGLGGFVADLLRGRIREAEIEREAIAQIRLLQAHGVAVTHLDTHKHTHMFARVLRPVLRAAQACGIQAIRNPFEPAWSVRATPHGPLVRRAEVGLLAQLRPAFTRMVEEAGLRTTDGAIGVLATGTLDHATLRILLEAAARREGEGTTWELVCHPGYQDAALHAMPTRLQAERERERRALAESLPLLRSFRLIHFGQL
jgi:predicted glycoside hydrolase/deacetylase ChbG (UPF0249 family)